MDESVKPIDAPKSNNDKKKSLLSGKAGLIIAVVGIFVILIFSCAFCSLCVSLGSKGSQSPSTSGNHVVTSVPSATIYSQPTNVPTAKPTATLMPTATPTPVPTSTPSPTPAPTIAPTANPASEYEQKVQDDMESYDRAALKVLQITDSTPDEYATPDEWYNWLNKAKPALQDVADASNQLKKDGQTYLDLISPTSTKYQTTLKDINNKIDGARKSISAYNNMAIYYNEEYGSSYGYVGYIVLPTRIET